MGLQFVGIYIRLRPRRDAEHVPWRILTGDDFARIEFDKPIEDI